MISYILIFLSSLSFLSSTNNKKIEKKIYSVIFTSALFSYSILGLVSLILINLIINLNETNSKTIVDLDLPSCSDGLTLEKCFTDYLYYDIYTGEKK